MNDIRHLKYQPGHHSKWYLLNIIFDIWLDIRDKYPDFLNICPTLKRTLRCTHKWANLWYPYIFLGSCDIHYRNISGITEDSTFHYVNHCVFTFQFSMLNVYHPYRCHLAIMQWAVCLFVFRVDASDPLISFFFLLLTLSTPNITKIYLIQFAQCSNVKTYKGGQKGSYAILDMFNGLIIFLWMGQPKWVLAPQYCPQYYIYWRKNEASPDSTWTGGTAAFCPPRMGWTVATDS